MAENLTTRQKTAVLALVAGETVTSAAARSSVTRETVYKWMHNPAFTEAIKTGAAENLDALSRRLVRLGEAALDALEEALSHPDTAQSVKVRAADITLSRLLQLRELVDIETRLTKLEEAQDETKSTH